MRRARSTGNLVDPLAEPERYTRTRLLLIRIKKAMVENHDRRPLKEFAQPFDDESFKCKNLQHKSCRYFQDNQN